MSLRKLKYEEKKLLKKVDFLQWKTDQVCSFYLALSFIYKRFIDCFIELGLGLNCIGLYCIGIGLGLDWNALEWDWIEMYWNGIGVGIVLGLYWDCIGIGLDWIGMHWNALEWD